MNSILCFMFEAKKKKCFRFLKLNSGRNLIIQPPIAQGPTVPVFSGYFVGGGDINTSAPSRTFFDNIWNVSFIGWADVKSATNSNQTQLAGALEPTSCRKALCCSSLLILRPPPIYPDLFSRRRRKCLKLEFNLLIFSLPWVLSPPTSLPPSTC